MSTEVPIEDYDYDGIEKMMNRICECGHKLYQHGFTDNYDYSTQGHYFRVSQCVMCNCRQFKEKKNED